MEFTFFDYLLLKKIKKQRYHFPNQSNKNKKESEYSDIVRLGNLIKMSYVKPVDNNFQITINGSRKLQDYKLTVLDVIFTKMLAFGAFFISFISLILSIFAFKK